MRRPRLHNDTHQAAEALARTAPLVSRWIERLLATHEPPLTVAQYLVLQAVGEADVLGSELARRTAVSPAAISQVLDTLEAANMLERQRLPNDRRRQPLTLTERGENTLRSAQALLQEKLASLLADLPPHETEALARTLQRLNASLSGTAPPPRPRRPPPPRSPPRTQKRERP